MVIAKIQGGLGNQMFQYANAYAFSKRHNKKLKLDLSFYAEKRSEKDTPRFFELEQFGVSYTEATREEIASAKPKGFFYRIYKKMNHNFVDYHPNIIKKKHKKYLEGYFQSEKNFKDFEEDIKMIFKYKKVPSMKIEDDSLSIHVRRGDYITNKFANTHHGALEIGYYNKAYNLIKTETTISKVYIFTDDTQWVKENFDFIKEEMVMASDFKLSDANELILMSECSNNIIANSSFSWWSAWLNTNPKKVVIAPKKWLKSGDGDHKNIIPKSWKRI